MHINITHVLVGQICDLIVGLVVKSTKIGIVDAKKVLIDFRYSAKQNVSHGALQFEKSKMAAIRVAKF